MITLNYPVILSHLPSTTVSLETYLFISAITVIFFRRLDSSSGGASKDDKCVICLGGIENAKKLKCGHVFCTDCVETTLTYDNRCPVCKEPQGVVKGNQPDGQMHVFHGQQSLPGYRGNDKIITLGWDPLSDLRTILGPSYSSPPSLFLLSRRCFDWVTFVPENDYLHLGYYIHISFSI